MRPFMLLTALLTLTSQTACGGGEVDRLGESPEPPAQASPPPPAGKAKADVGAQQNVLAQDKGPQSKPPTVAAVIQKLDKVKKHWENKADPATYGRLVIELEHELEALRRFWESQVKPGGTEQTAVAAESGAEVKTAKPPAERSKDRSADLDKLKERTGQTLLAPDPAEMKARREAQRPAEVLRHVKEAQKQFNELAEALRKKAAPEKVEKLFKDLRSLLQRLDELTGSGKTPPR